MCAKSTGNVGRKIVAACYYLLFKVVFAGLIYAGYVKEISGAENLVLVLAWLAICMSPFTFSEKMIKEIKERSFIIPEWLRSSFDVIISAAFIWFGSVFTGIFYLLRALVIAAAIEYAEEAATKHDNPES